MHINCNIYYRLCEINCLQGALKQLYQRPNTAKGIGELVGVIEHSFGGFLRGRGGSGEAGALAGACAFLCHLRLGQTVSSYAAPGGKKGEEVSCGRRGG